MSSSSSEPEAKKSKSAKPILGYWKIRGLAAPIRYILHYAKVEFEDVLYEQGPPPDFSKDCWFNVKYELGLDFPNLPYFIDKDNDNLSLTESAAILKYICKKWCPELLGQSAKEYARAEMVSEFTNGLKSNLVMPSYTGVCGSSSSQTTISCEQLYEFNIEHLKKIDTFRSKHGFKWLCGNELLWIDFVFWELLDYCKWLSSDRVFDQFPALRDYHVNMIQVVPFLKDGDQVMQYPFNNAFAKIGGRDSVIYPTAK